MRTPIFVLSVLAVACGAPAAEPVNAADSDDIALLWSARLPGASDGLTVVSTESVPWRAIPRHESSEGGDTLGAVLPILSGALHIHVRDGLTGEELVLSGPPARFLAATPNPPDLRDQIAAKKDVSIALPITRGGSAAALLEIEGAELASRTGAATDGSARWVATHSAVLAIDVVWADGDDTPTVTATISRAGLKERTTRGPSQDRTSE